MPKLKKHLFKVATSFFAVSSLFVISVNAHSPEELKCPEIVETFEEKFNNELGIKLNNFAQENNLNVYFEDFDFSFNSEVLEQYELNDEFLDKAITNTFYNIKPQFSHLNFEFEEMNETPSLSNGMIDPAFIVHSNFYQARVWAGIPAIGWGHINQDFRASVSGGRINSISMMGSSWLTGISLGRWTHNRSWSVINSNRTTAEIHIRGSLNYTWDLTSGGMTATFIEFVRVNGNRLARQF